MSGFIYLASPYSDLDPTVREERFVRAAKTASYCFQYGIAVYSPIAHWHPIAKIRDIPTDAASHQKQNDIFMTASVGIAVLCLPGWQKSLGVQYEIKWASEAGLPYVFVRNGWEIVNHAKEVWGLDHSVHGLREKLGSANEAALLDSDQHNSGGATPEGLD